MVGSRRAGALIQVKGAARIHVKSEICPVIASSRMFRRALLMALCLTFVIGAPLAGVIAAEQPCATPETAGDASPCGDCESSAASGCALACGIASPAPALAPLTTNCGAGSAFGPVAGKPRAHFASFTGPPGLQPPR
jgi:hypothetical protein